MLPFFRNCVFVYCIVIEILNNFYDQGITNFADTTYWGIYSFHPASFQMYAHTHQLNIHHLVHIDHSYNKYCNLIGYWQVSMCDSHKIS